MNGGLKELIEAVSGIVKYLLGLASALALLAFLWGLMVYMFKAGSKEGRKNGRNLMVWGTIALVVMICVWGIVSFFQVSLGVDNALQLPLYH